MVLSGLASVDERERKSPAQPTERFSGDIRHQEPGLSRSAAVPAGSPRIQVYYARVYGHAVLYQSEANTPQPRFVSREGMGLASSPGAMILATRGCMYAKAPC